MARTVVLDLAGQVALARDLAAGGVLVPDMLELEDDVELVLRGAGDEMWVAAKCVWVNGDQGSGLQLIGFDADAPGLDFDALYVDAPGLDGPTEQTYIDPTDETSAAPDDADETVQTEGGSHDDTEGEGDDDTEGRARRKIALNVHERLRGISLAQQVKLAGHGELAERIVLERMYGKNVWEPLLRNQRLTGPEVARIARMGALPRPLMEIIVGNGAWLQIPEVRRALLSNPRLATDQINKVLRMLPKHELKLAAMQTAYPFAVRNIAKQILREMGVGI